MEVVGRLRRWVVVHDDRQEVDVDASRGDVSRDEHLHLTALHAAQRAFALGLGAVTVQRHGGDATLAELASQSVRAVLGAGEDDRALVAAR